MRSSTRTNAIAGVGTVVIVALTYGAIISTAFAGDLPVTSAPTTRAAGEGSMLPPRSELESRSIRRSNSSSSTKTPISSQNESNGSASESHGLNLPRVAMSLAIVGLLVVVVRVSMRKLFPAAMVGRSSQAIKVISRSVLAPKQQFLLLHVGKRLIVVGDTGTSMNALAEITDPIEVAELIGTLSSESSTSSVATSAAAFGALFRKSANRSEKESDERMLSEERVHEDYSLEKAEPAESPSIEAEVELEHASGEIKGLMERVRMLSAEVRR